MPNRLISIASPKVWALGLAANRGASVLKKVDLRASDASEAVREAARLDCPPRALGFRLIVREGREIFGQDRG